MCSFNSYCFEFYYYLLEWVVQTAVLNNAFDGTEKRALGIHLWNQVGWGREKSGNH